MPAITVVAGSTGRASIVPTADTDYPTVESVAFSWADAAGTAQTPPTVTEATADDVTTYSAVIAHGPTLGHADEEWSGAFVIVRSGDDGEQTSRVPLRIFVVPESLATNFSDYVNAGGCIVPFADWARVLTDTERLLADVTMGRDITATETLDAVTAARYRIADALYLGESGVVSESLSGYSYTLASPRTRADATRVAVNALAGTDLTYRGL